VFTSKLEAFLDGFIDGLFYCLIVATIVIVAATIYTHI
jgi:hypothetical protein